MTASQSPKRVRRAQRRCDTPRYESERGRAVFRTQSRQKDRRPVLGTRAVAAAARFYCGALCGQPVGCAGANGGLRRLWFRVGDAIIETGLGWRARERIALPVRDPNETAERCWDAGFSVFVHDDVHDDRAAPLSVADPFGRRIDLVPLEHAAVAPTDLYQASNDG